MEHCFLHLLLIKTLINITEVAYDLFSITRSNFKKSDEWSKKIFEGLG